jgi:hypothetical protein
LRSGQDEAVGRLELPRERDHRTPRHIAVSIPSVIRIAARNPFVTNQDIDGLHHFIESLRDDGPEPIEPQIVDSSEKVANRKPPRPTVSSGCRSHALAHGT